VTVPEEQRRRSTRERTEVNYADLGAYDDAVAALRRSPPRTSKRRRGSKGDGLRAMNDDDFARRRHSMGGRVYDSELGVSCHWCRQKTVGPHTFHTYCGMRLLSF